MTASARADDRARIDRREHASWLRRPSLSRRIAIAMILSLIAIQGQAFLQIRIFSDPELRFMGTRWLAEVTKAAATHTFALPADQRADRQTYRNGDVAIDLLWSRERPARALDTTGSPIAARLRATLADLLGDTALTIRVSATMLSYRFPTNAFRLVVVPRSDIARFGSSPVRADEPDVLIPAGVHIAVQGRDGTWLAVEPIGTGDSAFGATLPYVPLLVGGLIIALVSTLTARHLTAPLDHLVVAANRVGVSREPVNVPKQGLHEFASVAQAFEDMQMRLLRLVDDRTEMLAAVSHDLRSSLTRLRLVAEGIREESEHHALTAEIEDMQDMLDSTLAFASGEARAVPNQRVDIAALLISLVDEAADVGEPCTYAGPDHAEVIGHPVALKRAFRNLIDNAIKYGGTARISITVEAERVAVAVEDDGPGIPAARIEEAFAPFRRLDAARTTPGAGLGLTIARDVIQAHGGAIFAERRRTGTFSIVASLPKGDLQQQSEDRGPP